MLIDHIKTKRLIGERLAVKHLPELLTIHNDPEAMATLGGIRSVDNTKEYLETNLQHWSQHGFGLWMFFDVTGKIVGRGGIRHVIADGVNEIEIAYALVPEFWGQGLATEMAYEFVNLAKVLGIKDLVAITQTTNFASRRIMDKLEFHFEKEFIHHQCLCVLCRLSLG